MGLTWRIITRKLDLPAPPSARLRAGKDHGVKEEILIALLEQFDEIYARIRRETADVLVPEKELLLETIRSCAFRTFYDPQTYRESERAKNAPVCISPSRGEDAFRVFYNTFSQKIYIDLNLEFILAFREKMESELTLLCEIMQSILFIRPHTEIEEVAVITTSVS